MAEIGKKQLLLFCFLKRGVTAYPEISLYIVGTEIKGILDIIP